MTLRGERRSRGRRPTASGLDAGQRRERVEERADDRSLVRRVPDHSDLPGGARPAQAPHAHVPGRDVARALRHDADADSCGDQREDGLEVVRLLDDGRLGSDIRDIAGGLSSESWAAADGQSDQRMLVEPGRKCGVIGGRLSLGGMRDRQMVREDGDGAEITRNRKAREPDVQLPASYAVDLSR